MVRDYQKLIGNKANSSYYGIEAYAMARITVDALRKAGKDPTREKFLAALEGMNSDLGGFRVAYSGSNRQGSRFVEMTVVGPGGKILK